MLRAHTWLLLGLLGAAGAFAQPAPDAAPDTAPPAPPVEATPPAAPPPVAPPSTPAPSPVTPPVTPAAPKPDAAAEPAADEAPTFPPDAVLVIVHRDNPIESIDRSDLRAAYLGSARTWSDGTRIAPLLRPYDSAVAEAFFDKVLDMSERSFRRRWQKRQLSGRGMAPPIARTATTLLKAIAREPGAIGFILGVESTPGVIEAAGLRAIPVED